MKTILKFMKRITLLMIAAISSIFFAEAVKAEDAKVHSEPEIYHTPYSMKDAFFIVTSTATTTRFGYMA